MNEASQGKRRENPGRTLKSRRAVASIILIHES